jgi:mRNA interferase MazF
MARRLDRRLKRGEVWTISGGDYAGKPRPAVVVQDDSFTATYSVTLCPLTTNMADAGLFRLLLQPSHENGLRRPSRLMVDKISTIPRTRVGDRVGRLSDDEMARLSLALITFLGLAGSSNR